MRALQNLIGQEHSASSGHQEAIQLAHPAMAAVVDVPVVPDCTQSRDNRLMPTQITQAYIEQIRRSGRHEQLH